VGAGLEDRLDPDTPIFVLSARAMGNRIPTHRQAITLDAVALVSSIRRLMDLGARTAGEPTAGCSDGTLSARCSGRGEVCVPVRRVMGEDVEARGGHRFGEVEALAVVAAQACEFVVLFGALDAFGDHGHA